MRKAEEGSRDNKSPTRREGGREGIEVAGWLAGWLAVRV